MTSPGAPRPRPSDGLEPLTLRAEDAAKLTGLSISTLYNLMNSGELTSVRIGKNRLIPYDSLKQLLRIESAPYDEGNDASSA